MCGIIGVIDIKDRREVDRELLVRMRDSMTHRGPDEAGTFFADGIGFGHRRLSIIDLKSGQQPMSNKEESVTITFNGEIYNYKELRNELKKSGYRFSTDSDTEVILYAWQEWGEACVDRLRGMFAFGIWDRARQCVFLARDRLGIKPLLYAVTSDGWLVFGSEAKSLLLHPGVTNVLYEPGIESYFAFGYVPEPHSIHRDVRKLEAGHTLVVRRGAPLVPRRYWDIPSRVSSSLTYAQAQEELVERLSEATRVRLVADVPLGAFLSGGVDSSAIVALMSELDPSPVRTCSIGFNERSHDETEYASSIANAFGTQHEMRTVSYDAAASLNQLIATYDEPFADSSAIPTMHVSALARESVKVALSGDGADELLSGYRRHVWHNREEHFRRRIPQSVRRALFGTLGRVYPKADWLPRALRARSTLQGLASGSVEAYIESVSRVGRESRESLFLESFRRRIDGARAADAFSRHVSNAESKDPLDVVRYIDAKTWLVDDILTKVDRASMAYSLEVRVPFLDHMFVEWCATLPSDFKIRDGVGKAVLKDAMSSRLPHNVLHRPKMGFGVPLAEWIRGPLAARVKECLNGERLRELDVFSHRRLDNLVGEHSSGVRDHSTEIWSLLVFDAFLEARN